MAAWIAALGALLLSAAPVDAGTPDIPFFLPLPKGWRAETMTFPLSFASLLPYRGLEELRFSPGMFKPGEADFFSYGFVWWLEGRDPLSPGTLSSAMKEYFEGLAEEVETKTLPVSELRTVVTFERDAGARPGEVVFRGSISTYEPFATHQRIKLNARVFVFNCVDAKRTAVLFELSPQPDDDPVWKQLGALGTEFRCSKPR